MVWRQHAGTLRPMLATLADPPLTSPNLVYEPKYDGIRALIEVAPSRGGARVSVWSRNGNDKTSQFPAIVSALEKAAARLREPVILDGEIVALDERDRPAGFQRLQGRIHLADARDVERIDKEQRTAFIAFDLLRSGDDDLCALPLSERRKRLEALFSEIFRLNAEGNKGLLRLSEQVARDGRALHARALAEHWEGLIAKDASSLYQAGRRSPAWRKFKVVQQQEFVIGGWTAPRQTRQYFGALLLGVYESGALKYVGHTGTGFDQKELARLWTLLKAREIPRSPFSTPIKTNEPAHWVRPELVAQVKFTEWTDDEKLRHPVYLGLRDDKHAAEVVHEQAGPPRRRSAAPAAVAIKPKKPGVVSQNRVAGSENRVARHRSRVASTFRWKKSGLPLRTSDDLQAVLDQLRALEDARRDGELTLPNGDRLKVTNLSKIYWPEHRITKGELLRYYVEVSPFLLPVVEDRPLVMKRFPNGIDGEAFYQQRSREQRPPAGVRIETLADDLDPISEPDARRLIGGSLTTLLYMTQIAAISQDPWFSRVSSPLDADHAAIDLDPTDEAAFSRVLEVARWVRDELQSLGVDGFPKTSGASGLHVYVPLPPHTSYESGMLFCQIVATIVAARHPKVATVERKVARRPRGTVYVDFMQNILGKTLATAYSARASEFAGVSTPLSWKELDDKVDPRDFTVRSAVGRFRQVGDLWEGLRTVKPVDLERVLRTYAKRGR
jgi:bifunctional non-homologous end joining protein LigD